MSVYPHSNCFLCLLKYISDSHFTSPCLHLTPLSNPCEVYGRSKLLAAKLKEVLKRTGRATRTSCCTYNLGQMYCGKIIRL